MSWCSDNADWDDLLAYTTEKRVVVRHRWLGLVYYFSILAIVIYTIVGTIILQKGYAVNLPIKGGAVRSTVRARHDEIEWSSSFCDPAVKSGEFNATLPCVYPDYKANVLAKTTTGVSNGGLLVGTRVSVTRQELNTTLHGSVYEGWQDAPNGTKMSFYVTGAEDSTIMIQHSVSLETQRKFGGSTLMGNNALIVDTSNSDRPVARITNEQNTRGADVTTFSQANGDIVKMSDVLHVAGVRLDDYIPQHRESYRYEGVTITIAIRYAGQNTGGGGTSYSYEVATTALPGKYTEADEDSPTTRTVRDLRGVQVLFSQDGSELYVWSWYAFLLSWLSGAALIGIATTVANCFLKYLAPRRADYKLFVQSTTPDFSPDTDTDKQLLEDILVEKRRERGRYLQIRRKSILQVISGARPAAARP
uniref:Uncharacterized protein n=1 Tax=Coccolithus braarudii TaxID=221442 RepID=A0A7S0LEJ1_9EUKA|mmetsp:Transcript_36193/g.77187  ORF Transcript_36193/g.77187 Transcript_36193/m.77187 type:complete len:419 (+) Transcript_36193:168-1424(+)